MRWRQSDGDAPAEGPAKQRQVLIGAGLAMALAALLVVWVLIDDSGSSDGGGETTTATAAESAPGEAEIVTVDSLLETAEGAATPIYWAGLPQESELELSEPEAGRTYVRYLTEDAEAGDPQPFLTVGSYEFDDPAAALRSQGNEPGGVLAAAPEGGVVYFSRDEPESVYLAYPGADIQVEVFAPDFHQALELVTSGEVTPIAE